MGRAFGFGFFGCLGFAVGAVLLAFIGLALIAAALSSSDSGQELLTGNATDLLVRVEGTDGLRFSGSLGSLTGQRTVEGIVPATFTIPGEDSSGIFTAVLQKQAEGGLLRVVLECRAGDKSGSTTAAYGVVTVTCSP